MRDGGFDYAELKQDHAKLDAYLAALHAVMPQELASWGDKRCHAFWIDYNSPCVQLVVQNYPLKSIRKLDGAFALSSVSRSSSSRCARCTPTARTRMSR